MAHNDKYSNYKELSDYENENKYCEGDYRVVVLEKNRITDVVILAPHGGKIEPYTSKIASEIAGDKYCLYLFEGTKSNCNFDTLHITSTNFDEPRCLELLKNATISIAIHGKSGDDSQIKVGGRNQDLAKIIVNSLTENGFTAIHSITGKLSGTNKNNICNRTSTGKGVQLEIAKGLREKLNNDSMLLNEFSKCITQTFNQL